MKDFPYKQIIDYCRSKAPQEACGVVVVFKGRYRFIPCPNVAVFPELDFEISSLDYAKAEDEGEVSAVVHSHPKGKAIPSQLDVHMQKLSGTPWLIVGEDEECFWLENEKAELPLYGRKYLWNATDCYSFVRDWYKQEMNVQLPNFYRKEKFWEYKEELYLDNFKSCGFEEIPIKDLKYGDAVLLQLAGNGITSHAAIYLGGNTIGHHLPDRLSSRDVYGEDYMRRTTCAVRYKGKPYDIKNN